MKISEKKREKIYEQILAYLYSINPKPVFTFDIAREIARDEEFIKKLLIVLKEKGLISEVKKNSKGSPYIRRSRWVLTKETYESYSRISNINPLNKNLAVTLK